MKTLFINEEHLGYDCTYEDALKLVNILYDMGWDVEYGNSSHWQFRDEDERDRFNEDFEDAMEML